MASMSVYEIEWWRPDALDPVTRGSVELVIELRASCGDQEFERWVQNEPTLQKRVWLDRAWRIRALDQAGRRRRTARVLGAVQRVSIG
jgi:hypothetical protein